MSEITHIWEGQAISQRADGFVNLTEMAKSHDKKLNRYLSRPQTRSYISALSKSFGRSQEELIEISTGRVLGQGDNTVPTWAHPEIAIDFASWVNVHFRVWANHVLRQVLNEGAYVAPAITIDQSLAFMEKLVISSIDRTVKTIQALEESTNFKYHSGEAYRVRIYEYDDQNSKETKERISRWFNDESFQNNQMEMVLKWCQTVQEQATAHYETLQSEAHYASTREHMKIHNQHILDEAEVWKSKVKQMRGQR